MALAIAISLVAYGATILIRDSNVAVNRVAIDAPDSVFLLEASSSKVSIAFLTDLHVKKLGDSLSDLDDLIDSVKAEGPDLVILGGDFVDASVPEDELKEVRRDVVARLGRITSVPVLAVLGNHESWTNPDAWKRELDNAGVKVIDGRTLAIMHLKLCVRGLGDVYSGRFRFVEFPDHCSEMARVTVTHDPAGAFRAGVDGLVLAGHTHCGQIRLPILGAPWVPSDAPSDAHCGLYEDSLRTVFVSSGVGTSILPFRFGAQSQWDLISLTR